MGRSSPGQDEWLAGEAADVGGDESKSFDFARGDQVELAQKLASVLRAKDGPVVSSEGRVWRYADARGLFEDVPRGAQSCIVQGFAGVPAGEKRKPLKVSAADVGGAIRLAYDQLEELEFFGRARPGLAFADGFVEVTPSGAVKHAHSPDHRARIGYPFDYPGNAPSVSWLSFLDSLFRDDADRAEKIALLQEHAGASLAGIAPRYQRALVLVGGGENGKSVYAEVLSRAMPVGSVAAIPPQEWGNEYRRAMLAGKLLNVVSELPEGDIIASEAFKAIVTGDAITAREIREAPFTLRPGAGHVFAANALPGTTDQTDGFWRRFAVVPFSRSFKNDPARDSQIAAKLVASELPHVIAWSLVGAVRLLRAGTYTLPPSHHSALDAWRAGADPVSSFLAERFSRRNGRTAAMLVYGAFLTWASANGHRAMSSTKFGMRMKALGLESAHTKVGKFYPVAAGDEGDGLVTGWKGNPSPESYESSNASA